MTNFGGLNVLVKSWGWIRQMAILCSDKMESCTVYESKPRQIRLVSFVIHF